MSNKVTVELTPEDAELFLEFQKNYQFIKGKLQELNRSEVELVKITRSLHPFERLVIEGDKEGKPHLFVILRSFRQQIDDAGGVYMRVGNESTGFMG